MEFKKLGESISLVILCNVEPIFIHIKWMNERGIITGQELEDSINKGFTLNEGQSVFMIGKDINVYCDRNRFQIETTDITASQRIIDICRETLKLNKPQAFAAVGVNAYMDFTFISMDDAIRFGDTFVPLEQWNDIIPNPRVRNFTIQEHLENPTKTHPRRALNIQSLGAEKKTGLPVVRISINNHHPVKSEVDVEEVLTTSAEKYMQFYEWCNRIFNEKLA